MQQQEFTFWIRRHHCRKCGSVVCSDHLQKKMILPHINKTAQQKVCDNCFNGKAPVGAAPGPGTPNPNGGAAVSTPSNSVKAAPAPSSAAFISAPQAPVQAPLAPSSPVPTSAPEGLASPPVKPARPNSVSKPPKPLKSTPSDNNMPRINELSVQQLPAAPQSPAPSLPGKPAPGAPPPLPSTAPPPLPSSAPPAVPVADNETPVHVQPTRRGSTSKFTIRT